MLFVPRGDRFEMGDGSNVSRGISFEVDLNTAIDLAGLALLEILWVCSFFGQSLIDPVGRMSNVGGEGELLGRPEAAMFAHVLVVMMVYFFLS